MHLAAYWSKKPHYKRHKSFVSIKLSSVKSGTFMGRALLRPWKWLCWGLTSNIDSRGTVVFNSIFALELTCRHMQTQLKWTFLKRWLWMWQPIASAAHKERLHDACCRIEMMGKRLWRCVIYHANFMVKELPLIFWADDVFLILCQLPILSLCLRSNMCIIGTTICISTLSIIQ